MSIGGICLTLTEEMVMKLLNGGSDLKTQGTWSKTYKEKQKAYNMCFKSSLEYKP